jgi:hypothetical protein
MPLICAARLPNDTLFTPPNYYWRMPPTFDVDAYNACNGVTVAQVQAMQVGSMFGWNVPGADPDSWGNES